MTQQMKAVSSSSSGGQSRNNPKTDASATDNMNTPTIIANHLMASSIARVTCAIA
jgi:hypothetical protein